MGVLTKTMLYIDTDTTNKQRQRLVRKATYKHKHTSNNRKHPGKHKNKYGGLTGTMLHTDTGTTNNTKERQRPVGKCRHTYTHIQLQIIQWKAETGWDNAVQTHRRTYPPIPPTHNYK